jgi:hypothetical protein
MAAKRHRISIESPDEWIMNFGWEVAAVSVIGEGGVPGPSGVGVVFTSHDGEERVPILLTPDSARQLGEHLLSHSEAVK